MPTSRPAIIVLMPIKRPRGSTSGPPEWPGRSARSTAIQSLPALHDGFGGAGTGDIIAVGHLKLAGEGAIVADEPQTVTP